MEAEVPADESGTTLVADVLAVVEAAGQRWEALEVHEVAASWSKKVFGALEVPEKIIKIHRKIL